MPITQRAIIEAVGRGTASATKAAGVPLASSETARLWKKRISFTFRARESKCLYYGHALRRRPSKLIPTFISKASSAPSIERLKDLGITVLDPDLGGEITVLRSGAVTSYLSTDVSIAGFLKGATIAPDTETRSREPANAQSDMQVWFDNADRWTEDFPGEWIAIGKGILLAHGFDFAAVSEEARLKGCSSPFITAVPAEDEDEGALIP